MSHSIEIRKSNICQFEDGLGVFAKKRFKKGNIVITWHLKTVTQSEFNALSNYERENFCHKRNGTIYLYPDPERHVNRSTDPNVIPDFKQNANIALRDIEIGEELSIPSTFIEDFS